MTIRGGYRPHILRVELSRETVTKEALPPEADLRKYVGGLRLSARHGRRVLPPAGLERGHRLGPRPRHSKGWAWKSLDLAA